ncbi:hypothetical protein AC579_7087 [Pseudocercospora musae]|uniref:Uncharacterized protein n=1 Tax=Pseudocercospora musae TaxID=113226 RepID=A0A139GTF7_9PEZI|nr:hypothetical protein AC579_7087 [Pseudocercospora musae]
MARGSLRSAVRSKLLWFRSAILTQYFPQRETTSTAASAIIHHSHAPSSRMFVSKLLCVLRTKMIARLSQRKPLRTAPSNIQFWQHIGLIRTFRSILSMETSLSVCYGSSEHVEEVHDLRHTTMEQWAVIVALGTLWRLFQFLRISGYDLQLKMCTQGHCATDDSDTGSPSPTRAQHYGTHTVGAICSHHSDAPRAESP